MAQVCVPDSEPFAALGVLNTWEAWGQVADVWAGGLATPMGPGVDIHALPKAIQTLKTLNIASFLPESWHLVNFLLGLSS